MKDTGNLKIVLIGAGNVAWHLGHGFKMAGVGISQVISRSRSSAESLAASLNTSFSIDPGDFKPGNDCCLLCVSDDALEGIAGRIRFGNCLALHTAGSVPADLLQGKAKNYGVLYPLQTFTKNRPVDLLQVPFLVEASNAENLALAKRLASAISGNVVEAGTELRLQLHLAAVFAGNFTNHMYALAEQLLGKQSPGFELLKPLIRETAEKAIEITPRKAQTGPAVRGNKRIIEKHMALLASNPEIRELYRILSESIGRMKSE